MFKPRGLTLPDGNFVEHPPEGRTLEQLKVLGWLMAYLIRRHGAGVHLGLDFSPTFLKVKPLNPQKIFD